MFSICEEGNFIVQYKYLNENKTQNEAYLNPVILISYKCTYVSYISCGKLIIFISAFIVLWP